MTADEQPPKGPRIAGIVLAALAMFLWLILLAMMSDLGRSDPAGNAMAQGFAGLGIILLWVLLSILALITATKGAMPKWARGALLLVPASGVAAIAALELLARPGSAPWHWPLVIPALVPPLIATYCLWTLVRPAMTNARAAAFLGAVALISAAIVPMVAIRAAGVANEENTDAKLRAALAALPADAPLSEFLPFLKARDQRIASDARARIASLARRQSDAETMLARGELPLGEMAAFGLDMTPVLCESARAELRRRVAPLIPATPDTVPYSVVEPEVRAALNAMFWLTGYGCAVDAESLAWETMAKAHRNAGYDVNLLAAMREPGRLGKRLREDPERFSQLNAQSHLKAWLKFSDDPALREQVIAGARTVPSRTADAIEILTDRTQESGRFRLLRILPLIDLETTPALCAAATKEAGGDLSRVYRPSGNDPPRDYSELIDRLGVGRPLTALVWLGEHGCDVAAEARDAHELVSAWQDSPVMPWQDSPGRAAMLAALARLKKN